MSLLTSLEVFHTAFQEPIPVAPFPYVQDAGRSLQYWALANEKRVREAKSQRDGISMIEEGIGRTDLNSRSKVDVKAC